MLLLFELIFFLWYSHREFDMTKTKKFLLQWRKNTVAGRIRVSMAIYISKNAATSFETNWNFDRFFVVVHLEGSPCKTEHGESGFCKQIMECPARMEEIRQGKRGGNALGRCGFKGRIEIVCCANKINNKFNVRPADSGEQNKPATEPLLRGFISSVKKVDKRASLGHARHLEKRKSFTLCSDEKKTTWINFLVFLAYLSLYRLLDRLKVLCPNANSKRYR